MIACRNVKLQFRHRQRKSGRWGAQRTEERYEDRLRAALLFAERLRAVGGDALDGVFEIFPA